MNPPAPLHARGFTLIEVVVSLAVMLLIISSIFGVLSVSTGSYAEGTSEVDLETTVRRVLDRIGEDFRPGILATILPVVPAESQSASIVLATGYVGGSVTEGARVGYDLRNDPADPPDGIDNDRDGFIDEKMVVRIEGGTETIVAANVKDLRFTLAGNNLAVRFTTEKNIRGRRIFTFTDTEQVWVRN